MYYTADASTTTTSFYKKRSYDPRFVPAGGRGYVQSDILWFNLPKASRVDHAGRLVTFLLRVLLFAQLGRST